MTLNPYAVVPFICAILVGSLGVFAFFQNRPSRLHRLFFWLCLLSAMWPACFTIVLCQREPSRVIFFTRLGHIVCTIVPALFFDFVVTLARSEQFRWISRLYYLGALIIVPLSWLTNWRFPGGVYTYSWGMYPVGGPLMTLDAITTMLIVLLSYIILISAWVKNKKLMSHSEYNKLRYIVIAFVIFSFAPVDYLPKYGVPIFPFGSICMAFFALVVTYAILKHQILDFTLAIRRTAIYSILAALITASYLVAVLIMEKWFQGFFGYRSLVATSIVGFAIAMGFVPLKNAVQVFVDRYFFRGSQTELAAENERLRQELVRSEKLKAVATLAAGMAHEIKNPLASIKTFSEYLPQKYDDPAYREKFAKIMSQEVEKMNTLVQRLLHFARPSPPQLQPVRLSGMVSETLDFLQGSLLQKQIQVETAFARSDEVLADAAQLKQVFLNILLNSLEAMDCPGRITIATAQVDGVVTIAIADTGPGIAKKDLQRVFDPFYTTKSSGTGLGLSVVHSIVQEHGGRVALQSELGRGTTVHITLPVNGHQTTDLRLQTPDIRRQKRGKENE